MNTPPLADPASAQLGARRTFARAFVAALLLFFAVRTFAADAATPSNAAKTIVLFDGVAMTQVAEGSNSSEHWRDFIPADDDRKAWTRFASIREYAKIDDPKMVAGDRVRVLKRDFPQAHAGVLHNKTTGEVIIDFITWPADRKYVQFDVLRYSRNPKGGVIAQQYALRRYEFAPDFVAAFKSERHRLVNQMATHGLTVQ